jgi:predicted DNA-binding transcriptional regulator AlpA
MTAHDPSSLLSPQALSAETGIPVGTLQQWRYLGRGPAYIKLGQHVRYRRSDVDAWLESQRVTPQAV